VAKWRYIGLSREPNHLHDAAIAEGGLHSKNQHQQLTTVTNRWTDTTQAVRILIASTTPACTTLCGKKISSQLFIAFSRETEIQGTRLEANDKSEDQLA